MLDVEVGRRGDLDQVDVGRGGELLEGPGALEEQLAIDGLPTQRRVELIKVPATSGKLIGKEIGERYHLRGRVLRERRRDGSAARAAAKQTETDGGVCLVPESGAGLQKQKARGGCGPCLEKLATIHLTSL